MNKEIIMKLIDRAREAAGNAYCPYTNAAAGCALLAEGEERSDKRTVPSEYDNIIFTGCNIENKALSCSAGAGEVAVLKAVSEGYTKFKAICLYASDFMPFPNGKVCDALSEFNPMIDVIVANDDTYSLHTLYELFPFQPEGPRIE